MFVNSPNRFRNCGLIGVCPMGASLVRKRLVALGARHLPTPICLPKLVRQVDTIIRADIFFLIVILFLYGVIFIFL